MSDKHMKPAACPLCGNASSITKLGSVYNVSCGVKDDDSDTCGLVLYGSSRDTRKSMLVRWNGRVIDPALLN